MGKIQEGSDDCAAQPEQSTRPTILIVDDEPVVLDVCKAVLEANGFDAVVAGDGREGLRLYQELHPKIDLVLSDVRMPNMDGIQMVHEILTRHPHTHVILMTGFNADLAVPGVLRKLCAVLTKPFQTKTLLQTIRKCLDSETQRRHAG